LPVFLLFLTGLVHTTQAADEGRGFSLAGDRGDELTKRLLTRLGSLADYVIDTVKGHFAEEEWKLESPQRYKDLKRELLDLELDLEDQRDESESQIECSECVTLLGLLSSLINQGLGYDDVKNVTMEICYMVVEGEYNPDTLCEHVLDTYAPHVIYILNTTDRNVRYICQFYQICPGINELVQPLYDRIIKREPPSASFPRLDPAEGGPDPKESPDQQKDAGQIFSRPIRLLHITDIHVDARYATGYPTKCDMPLCCRAESNGTGSAMYWGDYPCNIPYRTADHIFRFIMNEFSPDIIVNTGDTVQHTIWDQPEDETIATDKWLTDRLWFFFPGIPSYLTIGNHDMTPTNLYYPNRAGIQELNKAMYQHWQPLSKFTDQQRQTFERGAYYTAVPFTGLRILSYNSEFGALDNFYSILNLDESEYSTMLQWMEDTLSLARNNNEKVILLGHHPTGGTKVPGYDQFLADLQARYGDIIILHLLGHNHDDMFSIVRDGGTGEPRVVQISSASMTSYTNTNPSIKFFYLEPGTFRPLDMETYHINLRADGNAGSPPLRLTYRASEDYGMADITPQSFETLVDRLETDRELFDLFRFNVDTQTGFEGRCDDRCSARFICSLRYADQRGRQRCMDAVPRGEE